MKRPRCIGALLALCVLLAGCSVKKPAVDAPGQASQAATQPPGPSQSQEPTIQPFPGTEKSPVVEPPAPTAKPEDNGGCTLFIASDIHYLSTQLTDFGSGFIYEVEHGDGKVVNYIWQITEAFLEEVVQQRPDALAISGDLSLNGELDSHRELAAQLKKVVEAGIPVVVIPSNHDINNPAASQFKDDVRYPAAYVDPGQFQEIYGDFGYGQAISRDSSSLSYVYQLDRHVRLLMLDTCQYDPVNRIGGMVRPDTYEWIDQQLEDAWSQGMAVIPIAHHNLLDQSEIYVSDCTIEHSEEFIDLLEGWDIPLFLSGHLHVQHFMRHGSQGIYEMVTGSLATPPCLYGVLRYGRDGSFQYHARPVDVEGWARKHGSRVEDLLQFKTYGKDFLGKVFYNQAQDEFKGMDGMKDSSQAQKDMMAKLYAKVNSAYYAGMAYQVRDEAEKEPGYQLWEEHAYNSILCQYLEYILSQSDRDYQVLEQGSAGQGGK